MQEFACERRARLARRKLNLNGSDGLFPRCNNRVVPPPPPTEKTAGPESGGKGHGNVADDRWQTVAGADQSACRRRNAGMSR